MKLYLVGAGTPTPTETRFGTCHVLQVGDDTLMFDCGPATTYKLLKVGLFPTQIDYLFLSHHHYDHNIDYPCFLLTRWNLSQSAEDRLRVWGPPPTEEMTERLIGPDGVFAADWRARTQHPASVKWYAGRGGPLPRPAPSVDVHDIGPDTVIEGDGWRVTAARAQHMQPILESLAYRVDSDYGSIVFAGDTDPCETVGQLAHDADTLVITCWDHQDAMDAHQLSSVMGTLQAAEFARAAQVKRLVLTHIYLPLDRPGSRERGIMDVGRVFDGEIIFGDELMILEL
jgi:ribonuclease Z